MLKVVATYQVPSRACSDPDKKGKGIALGMTIGSWSGIAPDQQARQALYAGEYLGFDRLDLSIGPVVRLKVAYPISNFPPRLSEILVAVFGKLSMDREIKLVDLSLPAETASEFPGPRYGIEGIRKKLNVFHRPPLMSIFKCAFGLNPKEYADSFSEQVAGGIDLVKDDEIYFDGAGRIERVKYCREVMDQVSHREKRQVIYAVNLSAPSTRLLETAHQLVDAGANALLVNVLAYGWNAFHELAADSELDAILVAHPALAGAIYPAPFHGISSSLLLGTFMRMTGADLTLFPSPYGNVSLPRGEALDIAERLREKGAYRSSFPVPSAGIHPGLVPEMIKDFGIEMVINAGGGVHHHPNGTRQGARAFLDAIEGVCEGKELAEVARGSIPLKEALAQWP
ncbi:MAG: 2,3-diketo-5-methylthiopentyl-1-phosphate enolase [Nitrospirae bacterium]|nr:2,3-diketo-5-methylthiopentyl-1-phosphate enolase [Nitrospirota bacterium]MBI3353253.1 2,3-diketo-5-methylthiopentyl-1-phosphate enolase [Nitrospirota bacterium]